MTPDGLEEHFYFGGGGVTNITPLGICVVILSSLAILVLSRKLVIIPFLVVGLLMPITQVIVVFGLHLQIIRLLIFVAWARIAWKAFITRSDPFPGPLTLLDKVFVYWAFSDAIMYTILWSDVGALINRLGFLYTSMGSYLLFRYLVRSREDIIRAIKILSLVAVPIAIGMVIEHSTGRNPFALFGGLDELSYVRDGSVRSQGPFLHSIVAGTFGATIVPLFVALWLERKGYRLFAALGIISSLLITITSSSSTPMMAYGAAVVGLCFWPMRNRMRTMRWMIVGALVVIQLFMKVPIWFLMNRIGGLIGGTGWHRALLIDQFVRRFFEWWLIGTTNNANWGLDMWDAINAYVRSGVEGGLLTFVLFVSILVIGFKRIGLARKFAEGTSNERLLWALGATLFSNAVAFLGIIYFDQSAIAWYLTLVLISLTTSFVLEAKKVETSPEILLPPRPRTLKVNKHPAPARPVATYRNRFNA